ncbi:MAG: HlyD family secretion protein [Flavobacterium sp.]
MEKKKTNKKFIFIFAALILIGGTYGIIKYIHSLAHESTDDAQVEKNINPIIPRVGGYITKVYVQDNQEVKKGDTLFTIDNKDYIVKLADARAALVAAEATYAASKADVGSSQANISVSDANFKSTSGTIESAKIRLDLAKKDFDRYSNLYKNRSITTQQFEQAQAKKLDAESQLQVLQEQQKASQYQKSFVAAKSNVSGKQTEVAEANINRAKAVVDAAELNMSYTAVTAQIDGQVSKINAQPGQFVQPGQSLFYIINNSEVWVIANFKETQLSKMVVGQKVTLKVDAYPDTEFEGIVSSFSPATGSRFSILPPDNATGNFVKTIQRLPVKITIDKNNDPEKVKNLRAGMNVDVDVHIK